MFKRARSMEPTHRAGGERWLRDQTPSATLLNTGTPAVANQRDDQRAWQIDD